MRYVSISSEQCCRYAPTHCLFLLFILQLITSPSALKNITPNRIGEVRVQVFSTRYFAVISLNGNIKLPVAENRPMRGGVAAHIHGSFGVTLWHLMRCARVAPQLS